MMYVLHILPSVHLFIYLFIYKMCHLLAIKHSLGSFLTQTQNQKTLNSPSRRNTQMLR